MQQQSLSPVLVQLEAINVRIHERDILKDIYFHLHAKEIVTLIGPNGAGKSTFVKILLGIQKASSGQVKRAQKLKMAYVPQKFNPSHSLPLRAQDLLDLEQCDASIRKEIYQDIGINKLLNTQVQRLSGGERQRVLLARALLRQPDILVLDEPMQGLDIQAEAELNAYVRKLPQRYGCAILIVSHDLQWVMQGTQRVVCLNKHICCSGLPEMIQHDPAYLALFGQQRAYYQHHHDHCAHGDHTQTCPAPECASGTCQHLPSLHAHKQDK